MDAGGEWLKECFVFFCGFIPHEFLMNYCLPRQNDVSDIPDLTFSMDADEEKHILYEKTEVFK